MFIIDNTYFIRENDNDGNAEDGTIQYYLYKTVNSGLGLLHIHYDKQQTN